MTSPANAPDKNDFDRFHLGDFQLGSGEVLPQAFLAYKTFGDIKNPAIIHPTSYTACTQLSSIDYLKVLLTIRIVIHETASVISDTRLSLNPSKYFIIVPALFGNGQSTSPSNSPQLRAAFPAVTFADNVRAQYLLVTQKLGLTKVKAVVGFSMGGAQAYQWAVQYPDFMEVAVPICASAKNAIHNNVFLEGVKSALIAARGGISLGVGKGQRYPSNEPWTLQQKEVGLKAFGRVYAGWGFSQAWYRQRLFSKHFGAKDEEEFLQQFWEPWGLKNDPDDLLVMLRTWQLGDVSKSAEFGGDLRRALQSIKCRVVVAPVQTDLYFPPEDSQFEVESMVPGRGTLAVVPSVWGHWGGGCADSLDDLQFLDKAMAQVFAETS